MGFELTRRRLIGGGIVGGLGLLGYGAMNVFTPAEAPPPDVPADAMAADGWTQTDQVEEVVMEQAFGPVTVTVLAHTLRFEDQGLVSELENREVTLEAAGQTLTKTLGDVAPETFSQPLSIFAATRIDIAPNVDNLPFGVGRKEITSQVHDQAQQQFEAQMENAGLETVSQTGTSGLDIDTGETATVYDYEATYPIPDQSLSGEGITGTLPGTDLDIAGYLAVWHHGDHVMIGAGAHPNENYTTSTTGELGTGMDATISVDLGLEPQTYREEMRGYVRQIS